MRSLKASDVLFLLGDLFDAVNGQDRSKEVNEVLAACARMYDVVIYTPGNHCLRGRENPWESFDIPSNVILPTTIEPLKETINGQNLLVGNLFYDFKFVDPAILGFADEEIRAWYRQKTNDGMYLFKGDTTDFEHYTEAVARQLNSGIDVLVTHVLPSPSLVTFRFPELTQNLRDLASANALVFTANPEVDVLEASSIRGSTPESFRTYWNYKSFVMGSDVIGNSLADPKDGLVALYGHNHREEREHTKVIGGKRVHFYSHQPNKIDV